MKTFTYKIILIIAMGLTIAVGTYIFGILPDSPLVVGKYEEGSFADKLTMDLDYHSPDPDVLDEVFYEATMNHEMIHSFQSMGVIDVDIPTAAAWGYFFEWRAQNKLTDQSKVEFFNEGMNSVDPDLYISSILEQYQSEFLEETLQSYIDGARMAGAMYALFKGSDESEPLMYILAVGLKLDHMSAKYAVAHNELFSLLFNFRQGTYFRLDMDTLDDDIRGLPKELREKAVSYIDGLHETHEIGLVRRKTLTFDLAPLNY